MGALQEFYDRLSKFPTSVRDDVLDLQQFANRDTSFLCVWASGYCTRAIGVVDLTALIESYIPEISSSSTDGAAMLAMSRASYSYNNLFSLVHDMLDNLGFLYGVKVVGKLASDYALSFHAMFDKSGELKTRSADTALNTVLVELFEAAKSFTDKDNDYKHKYAPGLIHLFQSESFIRSVPSIAGNLIAHLDNGAVGLADAVSQIGVIRQQVLPKALFAAATLLRLNV